MLRESKKVHVSLLKRVRASLINATFAKISSLQTVASDDCGEIAQKATLKNEAKILYDTAKIKEILHAFNTWEFSFGVRKRTLTFALNIIYIRILYQRRIKERVYLSAICKILIDIGHTQINFIQ